MLYICCAVVSLLRISSFSFSVLFLFLLLFGLVCHLFAKIPTFLGDAKWKWILHLITMGFMRHPVRSPACPRSFSIPIQRTRISCESIQAYVHFFIRCFCKRANSVSSTNFSAPSNGISPRRHHRDRDRTRDEKKAQSPAFSCSFRFF